MVQEAPPESMPGRYRIQPSVGVAVGMVIAYMVVVNGLQLVLRGDIDYADFFKTAEGAYRTAVIPLFGGWVLLIAFMLFARWDHLWKDAGRLRMSPMLWAPLVVMVLGTVARFADVAFDALPSGLLFAVVLASIGVGFAEEMLFRGIFLRGLRTNGRSEAHAALWTAVGFGLFHSGNFLIGGGLGTLGQIVLAGISGVVLYLARRAWGLIVVAMVLHGVFDMSSFLQGSFSKDSAMNGLALSGYGITIVLGVIALIIIVRKDKDITMGPDGPEPIPMEVAAT